MSVVLKQFVPSKVCLQCRGCCRFRSANAVWRPKLGALDEAHLEGQIDGHKDLDAHKYLKTVAADAGHHCRFLKADTNICGIYAQRPFECVLYPFIISRTDNTLKIYVHLSCPYVQDHWPHPDFDAYALYLQEFFKSTEAARFLRANQAMLHDYSAWALELSFVSDLPCL